MLSICQALLLIIPWIITFHFKTASEVILTTSVFHMWALRPRAMPACGHVLYTPVLVQDAFTVRLPDYRAHLYLLCRL